MKVAAGDGFFLKRARRLLDFPNPSFSGLWMFLLQLMPNSGIADSCALLLVHQVCQSARQQFHT